jgi:hypothetical protein
MSIDKFVLQLSALHYDPSHSLCAIFRDLLRQAQQRQKENSGTMYAGTVLYYLIGAQLELALGSKHILVKQHDAHVVDLPTDRVGDFIIKRVVIHITTSPTQMLMRKCRENLNAGYKAIIATVQNRVVGAEDNAEYEGIADRVEIWAAEQFLAASLYKLSKFGEIERIAMLETLVTVYNSLIDRYETDPSLHISIGK